MTQAQSPVLCLITRAMATTAALLVLERMSEQDEAVNFDDEVRVDYATTKAKFVALAENLRNRTMRASAANVQEALRHASAHGSFEGTHLLEHLRTSTYIKDHDIAAALQAFA